MRASRVLGRAGRWAFLALILTAAIELPAQAAAHAASPVVADPGGVGIRLLDVPADASADPRARLYIVDHRAPGSSTVRRIEVSNTTRGPLSVSLYAGAATIEDGNFVGAASNTANDLSSWCSVVPTALELPSGATEIVDLTIDVPRDASPGERYAAVWAEVRSGASAGIVQVNRVGIRLYVSVGEGAAPAADFRIQSLTAERTPEGLPRVVATVRNTGGRALDMAGSLELLHGPGGLSAGPFAATLGSTLAIGAVGHVVIALDERVPDGPWDAELILHSGLLERRVTATIVFPRTGAAAAVPASAMGAGWLLVAGAGLVLVCALVAVVVRRRRRSESGVSAR